MSDFLNKAKDMAGQHPDQARQGIDRAEDMVDQKTGGQHGDMIHKGGDMAEKQLGIHEQGGAPAPDAPPADAPAPDAPPADQPPA